MAKPQFPLEVEPVVLTASNSKAWDLYVFPSVKGGVKGIEGMLSTKIRILSNRRILKVESQGAEGGEALLPLTRSMKTN